MTTFSPSLRIDQRHAQTATPRLQRAVRLLQLSSLDFAHEVQSALADNPFLEDESEGESAAVPRIRDSGPDELTPVDAVGDAGGDGTDGGDVAEGMPVGASDDRPEPSDWSASDPAPRQRSPDGDGSAMDSTSADASLRDHLHGQLRLMPLSARDHALVHTIVEGLDDDGYLRMALEDLVVVMAADGLNPVPDEQELQYALKLVQSLDPIGVGARSVQECLRLQLSRISDAAERQLARRIVDGHMDRLAQRNTGALARALHADAAQVEQVCDRIRRLDPRPGWRFGAIGTQYITPDVIVSRSGGGWHATLNPAIVPRVRMNRTYADMFQRHRDPSHAELGRQLQEARWTIRNVEQRFSTILSVARAVLKRQQAFLDHGPLAMRPLGLREVADEVGIHESTVSRVTNNKYMATPNGVFELKFFFSRAIPTTAGGACSATAIRGVIGEMIAAENPSAPLSDVQITSLLERQGLKVARRTVTKYRQQLKLPAVEGRRHHQ